MIKIFIPGTGEININHLVSDFSGTLSVDGLLVPGVRRRLKKLAEQVTIHILTADTHGRAREQLKDINCHLVFLSNSKKRQDTQKADYVRKLGSDSVAALGNGKNDRKMVGLAQLGIAICVDEGCFLETIQKADILVTSPVAALDLLLHPQRLIATLRNQ